MGLRSGVVTGESAELVAARRRIRELECELAVSKRANELLRVNRPGFPGGFGVPRVFRGQLA